MIARALGDGVRSATRRPGLVALLWAWNLALALLVTVPFWRWISNASGMSPATDVLLDGIDLGLITHLLQADPGALPSLVASLAGLALLSFVSGAFLSGGILEVVMNDADGRPMLHRFFRGAGHFFGRFVRLLVISGVTCVLGVGLVAAALGAAMNLLVADGAEAASLWSGLAVQAVAGVVMGFFVLAHDYARAMTVLTGTRRMLRAWWHGLRFVMRHALAAAFIGAIAALGVLLTLGAVVGYDVAYSARAWPVILGAIVLQQAMTFLRTAVRVGQVGAQASYCAGLLPAAPAAPEAAKVATPDPLAP